jgi:uncharacterized repeat protein (TIGR01451 family)
VVCLFVATIASASDLKVELEARKIATSPSGKEISTPAETAAPGDVVEYRVTYTNTGATVLKDVRPEIPVPNGLVVLLGSDRPAAAEALLAGRDFVPLPALDAEGKPVSAEKLRAFRWSPAPLAAGAAREVVIRVVVGR